MPNSSDVASGQQATAGQYNALRTDVVDPATGHDHSGAAGHGKAMVGSSTPVVAAYTAAPGTAPLAAHEDHVHPRTPNGGLFGDGSDGNVTISATTTLTRDMYYNDLTINAGQWLHAGGYRIFVAGTLTNNGHIDADGGAASGTTAGVAAVGNILGNGFAGAAGTTGSGAGTAGTSTTSSLGGAGGAGGAGGTNGGGAASRTGLARTWKMPWRSASGALRKIWNRAPSLESWNLKARVLQAARPVAAMTLSGLTGSRESGGSVGLASDDLRARVSTNAFTLTQP